MRWTNRKLQYFQTTKRITQTLNTLENFQTHASYSDKNNKKIKKKKIHTVSDGLFKWFSETASKVFALSLRGGKQISVSRGLEQRS